MFAHRFDPDVNHETSLRWLALTFSSGFVNAGGLMFTGRFVTHVTGFATLAGVDLVILNWKEALGVLTVPTFFLGGAFLAGFLIDRPNRRPRYDFVFALSALALIVSTIAGASLGPPLQTYTFVDVREAYLVMALLCLSSGLQNAALTASSGSSVRTTHLTGITTDLGLGIARHLTRPSGDGQRRRELRANLLRAATVMSFVAGSAAGAVCFFNFSSWSFLLPAIIALYAAYEGTRLRINEA